MSGQTRSGAETAPAGGADSDPIRALVVDDETPARERLRDFIGRLDGIVCIGEAADGMSAIAAIDRLKPDLALLDVRMPRGTGLDVLDAIEHQPYVIFTTAYSQYAVAAFELQALDYLLKPFGFRRFRKAVERARRALAREGSLANSTRRSGMAGRSPTGRDGLDVDARLFVRRGGRILPVRVHDIVRLEAEGDYVAIHTAEHRHLVHLPLKHLITRLGDARFLRVHRSHAVNVDHLRALVPREGSRLEIELSDGSRVMASRSRSRDLRRLAL